MFSYVGSVGLWLDNKIFKKSNIVTRERNVRKLNIDLKNKQ